MFPVVCLLSLDVKALRGFRTSHMGGGGASAQRGFTNREEKNRDDGNGSPLGHKRESSRQEEFNGE